MKVSPYDPPFRWLVESETRDNIAHLVEFPSRPGAGAECSCEDFQFHVRPRRAESGELDDDCKHIRAARPHFHRWALNYYETQGTSKRE